MTQLRIVLIVMTGLMVFVTLAAVVDGGVDLLTPFVAPIVALTWQGQFNLDFSLYLGLSGLWMAWRGGFTRSSLALGILAPPLDMLFLGPYLIYLIDKTRGDARELLLGARA